MTTTWCVRLPDTERNFLTKRAAVRWLRTRTVDERIRPVVRRLGRGAYVFYGPAHPEGVLTAAVDRLRFASVSSIDERA